MEVYNKACKIFVRRYDENRFPWKHFEDKGTMLGQLKE